MGSYCRDWWCVLRLQGFVVCAQTEGISCVGSDCRDLLCGLILQGLVVCAQTAGVCCVCPDCRGWWAGARIEGVGVRVQAGGTSGPRWYARDVDLYTWCVCTARHRHCP